jgi:hypothetical protein
MKSQRKTWIKGYGKGMELKLVLVFKALNMKKMIGQRTHKIMAFKACFGEICFHIKLQNKDGAINIHTNGMHHVSFLLPSPWLLNECKSLVKLQQ